MKLGLRTELAAFVAVAILGTVLIGYGGLNAIGDWQVAKGIKSLTPQAARANRQLDEGRVPSSSDLKALKNESETINNNIENGQNIALVVLSAFALTCGIAASWWIARRFAEPLENAANAARRIASGDAGARAQSTPGAPAEIRGLIDDFNAMAAALEASETELSAAAAAIAHELRTPLTILRGRLQGVRDGVFSRAEADFSGLLGQVDQLARIVDDLETVSLAERGRLVLQRASMDLAVVVGDILTFLEPEFSAAGGRVSRLLKPVRMNADAQRIVQVVTALLDNARRHGGGDVFVSTYTDQGAGVLSVGDRGPGLDAEALTHAFDRFWRADASRTRSTGGSGLGLSVVRAVAQAHGGRVLARNRDGGGAEFVLELPI